MAQLASMDELMPTDEDLLYEEELLRNPYSLKMWLRYLEARSEAPAKRRYLLYERALKALPGSYKLWHAYLKERRLATRGLRPNHPHLSALLNTYERALVSMHKMPRIWLEMLELLVDLQMVTEARRAFDRALAALPVTQHTRVWVLYLRFLQQPHIPVDTAVRVYRRYLQLEPRHVEEFIAYLRTKGVWGEAAARLAGILNDDTFRSIEGKSKHQLWLELCDLITKHPKDVLGQGIHVDAILRGGIRRYTDEVGRLWTSLADFYIRRSMFERARDVYEEGLNSVVTVRDFGLVFDALTHFEESLLAAKMAAAGDEAEEAPPPEEGDDGSDFLLKDDGDDLDLRLARLEALTGRRPELLSSVMLRQNPHNVAEWHKRVKLFASDPRRQIDTYTQAVKTVDIQKALGKPHSLWVAFAKFYERHGDLPNARIIFEKAVQVPYKYVDDLASVWCEWAEMELRHNNFKSALSLMRRATTVPQRQHKLSQEEERHLPVQERLYRSIKLWSFYADLEESLGTLESASAVYDRLLELRLATPQIILNYALMLQEAQHWEASFRVYEKGVVLFKYPHVGPIWAAYLKAFVERYAGTKLERARDLFESALEGCPPDQALPLYLDYAKLEESHGLARHAMEVYERAIGGVPKEQRLQVVDLYLSKATDFFGIAKVREIFEVVIESEPPNELPDVAVRQLCVRYAQLERKLGEVDRARAIFVHGSHLAPPKQDKEYWAAWNEFEVRHGNEDTFREMLRIKRSVAASYAQMHIDSATQIATLTAPGAGADAAAAAAGGGKRPREEVGAAGDSMEALEAAAEAAAAAAGGGGTRVSGFVSAGIIQQGQDQEGGLKKPGQEEQPGGAADNPEEIDLGDDEDAAMEEEVAVQQKPVPAAVFGALADKAAAAAAAAASDGGGAAEQQQEPSEQQPLGAMERFKRRKVD